MGVKFDALGAEDLEVVEQVGGRCEGLLGSLNMTSMFPYTKAKTLDHYVHDNDAENNITMIIQATLG